MRLQKDLLVVTRARISKSDLTVDSFQICSIILGADEIVLELSAPNRAGIIRPAEPEEPGEDVLMLVMPVMLNA